MRKLFFGRYFTEYFGSLTISTFKSNDDLPHCSNVLKNNGTSHHWG